MTRYHVLFLSHVQGLRPIRPEYRQAYVEGQMAMIDRKRQGRFAGYMDDIRLCYVRIAAIRFLEYLDLTHDLFATNKEGCNVMDDAMSACQEWMDVLEICYMDDQDLLDAIDECS